MRGMMRCCFLVALLLTVVWAASQISHDHKEPGSSGNSQVDHHEHLHHDKEEPHPSHSTEDELWQRLSPYNADFAFSLYRKLVSQDGAQGKNIFFSPVSISMALSMLALGAKGETHSQIFSTLGYSALTPEQVNEGYEHFLHMLGHSQEDKVLEAGGAVAVREGFKPLDKFLQDAQHFYSGEAFSVDFSNPEVAVKEVNKYIAKKTKDMIPDMIKTLDQNTVMMLINYVYFRGKWERPFDVKYTHKADFHVDKNTKVKVDMMTKRALVRFHHDKENATSIVMLPYKGSTSMMIVLPEEGRMQELEENICREYLIHWQTKFFGRNLELSMPKFSTSASMSLQDTLMGMGMVDAFSSSADFSGISEKTKLQVSKVLHQAVLKVDERGTEAAATTTIEKVPYSMPTFLRVNRPFLVFIVEPSTMNILFMGKITDPTAH